MAAAYVGSTRPDQPVGLAPAAETGSVPPDAGPVPPEIGSFSPTGPAPVTGCVSEGAAAFAQVVGP
ncbi:hypothetical protein OCAE111667_26950 [Occultella aeris]|uniref:Uncharacterized protein n=1 Tax=Occultella aeris TaxID=2761496 RepID=A0A7M4DT90_9MICO|nr:hypothetical protein HALOF300_05392 [Occultella aeris]